MIQRDLKLVEGNLITSLEERSGRFESLQEPKKACFLEGLKAFKTALFTKSSL